MPLSLTTAVQFCYSYLYTLLVFDIDGRRVRLCHVFVDRGKSWLENLLHLVTHIRSFEMLRSKIFNYITLRAIMINYYNLFRISD